MSVTLCTYINRYNISLIIYRIENRRYDPDTDTIYIELYGNYMIGGLVSAGGAILLAQSAIFIHGIKKVRVKTIPSNRENYFIFVCQKNIIYHIHHKPTQVP